MRKPNIFASMAVAIFCSGLLMSDHCSADIVASIFDDFESATIGATSTANAVLPGTAVRSINILDLEVVAAPAGFTTASGNVVAIDATTNAFGALGFFDPLDAGAANGGFTFQSGSGVALASDPFTLTFDMYIPEDLLNGPVARFQPRFGGSNHGTITSMETTAAGVYQITYSGTLASAGFGGTSTTTMRPFIFFEQDGVATENVAFIDNLSFTVGVAAIPEPSSLMIFGLVSLGLVTRRRR